MVRRLAVAAGGAGLLAVAGAVPAQADLDTGGLRDVREFACAPGRVPVAGFGDTVYPSLSVDCVAAYGVTRGTTTTTYEPFSPVPRYSMAVFLARLVATTGEELPAGPERFADTGGLPSPVQDAVEAVAAAGISTGRTPTTFDPYATVERDEMASFLTRTQAYLAARDADDAVVPFPAGDPGFDDVPPGVHAGAVGAVRAAGVAAGVTAESFAPDLPVSRQQMALFLARHLDVLVEQGALAAPLPRDNSVVDVSPGTPQARVAVVQDGPPATNDPSDDVEVTFSDLPPAGVVRVVLVPAEAVGRAPDGALLLPDADDDGVADELGIDDTPVRVTDLNGVQVNTTATNGVASTDGTFDLRLDSLGADEVVAVAFPRPLDPVRSGQRYVDVDPDGLDLASDLRPVEPFGATATLTWTAAS